MGGARLTFDNVSFAYGRRPVLDGVSLDVAAGERFGILGPNGSGKSTLVRLVSGVLELDRGRILVDGRDLAGFAPRELARRVAVVPQETALDFPFSVLEVVLMGRSPHLAGFAFESEADLAAAARAMEETETRSLASRSFQELSGGEKQRVVIARALAQEPDLLLLDEPTAFLDIRHEVAIFDLVTELSEARGITVVVVLHDLNLAALYCDRIAFLKDGRVLAEGATEKVLTYANVQLAYETEVYVEQNELTGRLNVLPLPRRQREELARRMRERT